METSISPMSFKEVFDSPCIPLGRIIKISGPDRTELMLYNMFTSFFNNFTAEETINEQQIHLMIQDVMADSECRQLSIEDLKMFFRMSRTNKFGAPYGKLNERVIFEWFRKFFNWRCEEAIRYSETEDEKYKPLVSCEKRGVTFEFYMDVVKRASEGDIEAQEELKMK